MKRSLNDTVTIMKKRRKKLRTLLQILSDKGGISNLNSVIRSKLGVQNRLKVTVLLSALQRLDKDFTQKNFEAVESVINTIQLSQINFEYVKPLEKRFDAKILIDRDTRVVKATSKVLLDCTYQMDDCVVKVMAPDVDKVELFIETIINIFISAVTVNKFNEHISTPNVITMGYFKKFTMPPSEVELVRKSDQLVLVQEKIDGVEFSKITRTSILAKALITLCKGLKKLQDQYNFAHRDFHCNNVMYSEKEDRVYIIDFGYSCFSVKDTPGSIQTLEGGFGFNQLESDYQAHIPCINKSSDLCTLILSLVSNFVEIGWLADVAKMICKKYKEKYRTKSQGWKDIDKSIGEKWKWDREIFYYWYIYEMFEIDIGFGPEEFLDYMKKKFPQLKF